MNTTKSCTQNSLPVRELARKVYECLLLDVWPSSAGITDFGLKTTQHYAALQYAIREHGVTAEDLDDALGCGPALTELIREDNPHHGVAFTTAWDTIMVPIKSWAAVTEGAFPLGRLFATPEVMKVATRPEIIAALRTRRRRLGRRRQV